MSLKNFYNGMIDLCNDKINSIIEEARTLEWWQIGKVWQLSQELYRRKKDKEFFENLLTTLDR